MAATHIALGNQDCLYLGNLNAKRDWGFAGDYVEAMWMMLQQDKPDDYVIATGITTSVRDFVTLAFHEAGIDIEWHGEGIDEYGVNTANGATVVRVDPRYFRPTEVDLLLGDPTKAKHKLGWEPRVSIAELVKMMIASDMELAKRDKLLRDHHFAMGNHGHE